MRAKECEVWCEPCRFAVLALNCVCIIALHALQKCSPALSFGLCVLCSQQDMFQALEVAGNSYPVIVEKLKEGLAFYRRLSGNVTKLRDRVREVLRQHRASDRDRTNEPAAERTEPSPGLLQPAGVRACVCACVHVLCVCACICACVHVLCVCVHV